MRAYLPLIFILLFTFSPFYNNAYAYETDQYSTLFYELDDSTESMDKIVNDAIEHVVRNWNKERNDYSLLSRIAGFFHSRQLEKWVNESPIVESRNVKSDSIFKTTGWKHSFIIRWKGLAASFSLNNVQMGTDKLSHFFGVGWIYWKVSEREHQGKPEGERRRAAIEEGIFTEQTYWGRSSTNIYSNADLVANWEGYLFYRSVLEDNIVPGKKAIIRWDGDTPIIQRKFTFRDHANDFWSEALLPNDFDPSLAASVTNVLMTYCEKPEYLKQPDRWVSTQHDIYWKRYLMLGLKPDALKFRLDAVCAQYQEMTTKEKQAFKAEQQKREQAFKEDTSDGDFRLLDFIPFVKQKIGRMDSPVPTCNSDIKKAKNEFHLSQESFQAHSNQALTLVTQYGQTILTAKENDDTLAANFYKQVFGKYKHSKIKTKNLDNLTLRRLTKYRKFSTEKVKTIAEYSNYGEDQVKICLIHPIPFQQSSRPVRYDFIKSSNYYCAYIDRARKTVETTYFWRAYDKEKKLRSSLEGYYDFLDEEAYIYRMIPKHCKWY
ncbi:hypothetical protein [Teredinibacter sp. KSP-S5-2]|uniref:hypothetical protein n=1 Tax=Teredinibacter sp. KSP-S5-2 TaxID=3034506 RepID=UPI002934A329|nr:hypothetical protein [Teredinibacter sp. KSP-S5-2]WNO08931.1 hypothetical protein P5V12_18450 [Teredinibacter sp. KSP-S5-2]